MEGLLMENRIGISNANEFPQKLIALGLKSSYELKEDTKNCNLKRKGDSVVGDERGSKKRRKSRKEVSLSCIKNDTSNSISSSGSAKEHHGGLSSSLPGSNNSNFELSQKLNSGSDSKSVSHALNDKVIHIPKRKRGFVRRKKLDGDQGLKAVRQPDGESGLVDQIAQLAANKLGPQVESSKAKKKKGYNDSKDCRISESNSATHLKGKDSLPGHSNVNNGDLPLKKPQRIRRKRKNLVLGSKSLSEAGPSIGSTGKIGDGTHNEDDNDDDNLEQNAARMLSSRFNPSCIGVSSTSKTSTLPSRNGLPFMLSSGPDFVGIGFKSLSCAESAPMDAAGRLLRPREQHKEKGQSRRRKRRHFYEVFSGDLDAYWVLNRKIKIFWPLDQSWYYGLISAYDEERKLHYVKYDDRDEEWINLQNERIKLLLMPSEAPHKVGPKKSSVKDEFHDVGKGKLKPSEEKEKIGSSAEDDSYMDSEPIISLLARSSRRVKTARFGSVKNSKISDLCHRSGPAFDETVNGHGCLAGGSMERDRGNILSRSALLDSKADVGGVQISNSCQKSKKCPIVYARKRYRNHTSDDFHISSSVPELVTSVSSVVEDRIISFEGLDSDGPFWSTYKAGPLTIPLVVSKHFKFDLNFPVLSVLNCAYGSQNLWMFHIIMLLQYGTLVTMWPRIHLEMLFVDNIVGLRLLLFEGCLKQAVAFIFLVLTVFNGTSETGKFVDLQLPVTTVRFKFSQIQNLRKQIVFAFHNFSELNNSKWLYLNSMLEGHCILKKQLPISECTYNNIKALQCGTNLLMTSTCQEPASNKMRSRKVIGQMGISRDFTSSSTSDLCNSDEKRALFPFALSFTSAPTFFLGLHLKQLMEHTVTNISFRNHDSVEITEQSGRLMAYDCCSGMEDCSIISPKAAHENDLKVLAGNEPNIGTGDIAVNSNGKWIKPSCGSQNDKPSVAGAFQKDDREVQDVQESSNSALNMNDGIIPSPNPTAPRSMWHQHRYRSSLNSSFGHLSHGWSDGPKKPRTQVSYSMPCGGTEFGLRSRSHSQKGFAQKRIRKASERKSSDVSRGCNRNLESLTCDANVLITVGDKGWRECGVQVILELLEENECRLAVKVSGNVQYSHKAHQFLQPGSTNRYTHAMMWKGGKDWALEFPDRTQWALFKEMHEECYNRNFRAALIKNIPIPGVRLVEENDDCSTEVAFVRSSRYFRQIKSDVEMALDPSRILYDMDSDDEQWLVENCNSLETGMSISGEVLEQVFEKTMDMFEKASYTKQCDQFTCDEIAGLVARLGFINNIHEYWQQKRQTKGMPLIRHLQPPLWERYQHQLRDWELAISKTNTSNGYYKTSLKEKPPMFAFCLKPRGLEVPNKGPKQKSHRKISDGFHDYGRRVNVFALGDEDYEPSDDSPSPRTDSYISTSSDGFDRSHHTKLSRKKSKNIGFSTSPKDPKIVPFSSHGTTGQRNGNLYQQETSQSRGVIENLDVDEFGLRDASGVAKYAINTSKLKREKARRLMCRADLAIHKAVVALTTAEAIKACLEDG